VSTDPTDRPTPAESPAPAAGEISQQSKPHHRKHKAHIAHKVAGRIRMKVPGAKGDPAILAAYQQAFSAVPGITQVKVKEETSSIVIHYDPAREQEIERHFQASVGQPMEVAERPGDEIGEIARKIEAEAEFLAGRSELAKATVDFFKKFDRELKLATDNTIDLKILLAGGLAAFTFFEIGAEAATPMWVTLALFSLNHFAELHTQLAPPVPARA
jgi:hypothetical protein